MEKELRRLWKLMDGIGVGLKGAVLMSGFDPNSLKPDKTAGFADAFDGAIQRIQPDPTTAAMLADLREWIGENISACDALLMGSVPLLPLAIEPLKEMESECRKSLPEVADYLKARIEWLSTHGFPRTWDEMQKRERQ